MVQTIIGSDCFPVRSTTARSKPKPSRTTAHWRIFLEVNLMPGAIAPWSFSGMAMSIPKRMAMTGPPTMGKKVPRIHAGMAMTKHSAKPFPLVFKNFMGCFSLSQDKLNHITG